MAQRSVSRVAESQALAAFLATAATGPAGLVVEGEAGIGKTTLALEAAAVAREQGFRVLMSRGSPSEVTLSFAGLADLVTDVGDDVLTQLPQVQRDALDRILLRGNTMPMQRDGHPVRADRRRRRRIRSSRLWCLRRRFNRNSDPHLSPGGKTGRSRHRRYRGGCRDAPQLAPRPGRTSRPRSPRAVPEGQGGSPKATTSADPTL